MTEWKDDLRKFMLHAGLRNTPTVFLFSDTQVMKMNFSIVFILIYIYRLKVNHFLKI